MILHPTKALRTDCFLALRPTALAGFALMVALIAAPAALAVSYQARAYCLETGDKLYSEHHRERWQGDRLVGSSVEYRKPGGEVFATKTLSYEAGVTTPSFEMKDHRSGYREGARVNSSGVLLFAQQPDQAKPDQERMKLPAAAVIDAGLA